MAFKLYEFRSPIDAQHFMNGGIEGGIIPPTGVYGLIGLTLTFLIPVAVPPIPLNSVTFVAGAKPGVLLFGEIKSQLETAIPALKMIQLSDGRIGIHVVNFATVVKTTAGPEAARPILGMPPSGILEGKLVVDDPTGVSTPRLASSTGGKDGSYILVAIWE
jgi:hypothetical protein